MPTFSQLYWYNNNKLLISRQLKAVVTGNLLRDINVLRGMFHFCLIIAIPNLIMTHSQTNYVKHKAHVLCSLLQRCCYNVCHKEASEYDQEMKQSHTQTIPRHRVGENINILVSWCQVWYLIVSIPDLCRLSYLVTIKVKLLALSSSAR